MVGLSSLLPADDHVRCPDSIAAIEANKLTENILPILAEVYEKAGCPLKLTILPGRRGIQYFNSGKVDGEAFRYRIAEEKFERPFVRSEVPLLLVSNSLWRHPDHMHVEKPAIGYAIGVLWQEQFVENKDAKKYRSTSDVMQAYNAGEISAFIAADITVIGMKNNSDLTPPPMRAEVIHEKPLYHYLSSDLTPFMFMLSDEIKKNNPFSPLTVN